MKRISRSSGFTLLEILLVVAAISILAGIVIVAINPGRQLGETRNAQRKVDLRTILSAVQQYQLNNGRIPETISEGDYCGQSEVQEICATGAGSCSGMVDLSVLTEEARYITAMPTDPSGGVHGEGGTGYMVILGANGRVTACAAQAELGESISVSI